MTTAFHTYRDPIDRLAETLTALDEHINRTDAVAQRSERNRLSMLHVHAAAAVVIAPGFAAVGKTGMAGPSWEIMRAIPAVPYSLAALLLAGGLTLGVATIRRNLRWEIVGLSVLLAWYATVSISFGAALVDWLVQQHPESPVEAARMLFAPALNKPTVYAPALYAHLSVIMAVHMRTLRRMMRRDGR